MARQKAVLVLDAQTDQAIAVARGLTGERIPIHIAGSSRWDPGFWSILPTRRFVYPSPLNFPEEFISWMSERLKEGNYEAVFPLTDSTLVVIERFRNAFPDIPFAMPEKKSYGKISDKFFLQETARKCGFSVPETFYPESVEDLEKTAETLDFPVVVKPRYSRFYDEEKKKVEIGEPQTVSNLGELKTAFSKLRLGSSFPCVQKWVKGTGVGVELLIKKGEPLAAFCHERIREMNPLGSGSSASQSISLRKDLLEASLALLKYCDYEGVAMVEFRADSREGKFWFMEINARFWGSLALPVACGVNFPYLYLESFVRGNRVLAGNSPYLTGIQMRSLWKETSRLLQALRGRRRGWKGPFPSRREALREYFVSFFKAKQVYADFKITDPFPAITATLPVISKALVRLLKFK